MERLIDAGKILDNLSGMLKSMDDYDAVKKVINDMPTAYDVDAVVEQISRSAFERHGNLGMGGEKVVNLDDAIELVKGGGVDA